MRIVITSAGSERGANFLAGLQNGLVAGGGSRRAGPPIPPSGIMSRNSSGDEQRVRGPIPSAERTPILLSGISVRSPATERPDSRQIARYGPEPRGGSAQSIRSGHGYVDAGDVEHLRCCRCRIGVPVRSIGHTQNRVSQKRGTWNTASRNELNSWLVAGGGFEPPTFGL